MVPAILYSLAVLIGIFGIYSYMGYRAEKRTWRQKVGKWFDSGEKRKSFIVVWGDKFDQGKLAQPMHKKLRQANIPLTPSEFYGMLIVGGGAIAVFSKTIFKIDVPINLLIALGAVAATYFLLFLVRKNKYQERLNSQLAEICRLLANSVRAGMTIQQGLEMVAYEIDSPAKEEFQQLSHELRLGVDFERALRAMQERNQSRDFKLFIATLLIQKKAGGNLHAVLDEMSRTLDDRKILNQTIKTMTAEQRFISYILPAMPVFILLMMNQMIDGFLDNLATVPGAILGVLFVIGTVLSFILVRKVTNIRV
ncbi:type II secretion system F family protein [Falsibacillus pallidus]|uniref:type II secretion system F family protein n=1 Tax=Falsibacillus pallidus TaxID=493781 RepID=UPI003D9920EF